MEFVYLWVENYKNIKNQGFSFSPRFECKYDKDSNELTIEPKEYTSIFPSNINVTAIVGENGSGKSGLLEYIENYHMNFEVIKENKKFNKKKSYFFNTKPIVFQIGIERIYYDNIHNTSQYNKTVDLNYNRRETILNYFRLFNQNKIIKNTKLVNFIKPDYISIEKNMNYLKELIDFFQKNYFGENLEKKLNEDRNFYSFKRIFILSLIIKLLSNVNEKDEYFDILDTYQEDFFTTNMDDTFIQSFISENNFEEEYNNFLTIINFVDFRVENSSALNFVDIKKLIKEGIYELLMSEELFPFFSFDFSSKNKSRIYSKLSTGEKSLFSQFVNLFCGIDEKESSNNLILLDEPDNYLHPNWKKVYVNELIAFLENSFPKKKFQIIFTTHSPFLLSDLPKENIIFLKKGKQVYPDIETFGANIHTLLSHGFFMKDGLMGKFAKGKIDEAIKILNQKKLSGEDIKYCENIISIVGEPILKRQLQKMLDSKRLTKIDDLEAEIELMKHRIEIIRKNQ